VSFDDPNDTWQSFVVVVEVPGSIVPNDVAGESPAHPSTDTVMADGTVAEMIDPDDAALPLAALIAASANARESAAWAQFRPRGRRARAGTRGCRLGARMRTVSA
jgi:hypothetical protein